MDDLLFPPKDQETPAKPIASCWGCGVEQGPGKRFKQCRKCVQCKVIPAKFCSDECFHSSRKLHKAWHTEQERQLSQAVSFSPSRQALKELSERSEYDSHLAQANIKINAVDIAGAQSILRKAVKLDSSRPEAHFSLAICSEASGHFKEAVFYYERSIERWAFVALTGVIGGVALDKERHPTWALEQWSTAIDFCSRIYMAPEFENLEKREWFCVDGLLQIVARIAVETTKADATSSMKKKARLSLLQAFALTGMIHNGIFQRDSSNLLVGIHSSTELLEAAACFRFVVAAARAGTDLDLSTGDVDIYSSHIRTCTNLADLKMTEELNRYIIEAQCQPVSVPSVGSWVAIHEDTRTHEEVLPIDPKTPEFGQVLGVPYEEDKIPVKVQGRLKDELLLFSTVDLVPCPQNEQANALVACLEMETQWKFMESIFEALNEQGFFSKHN